MLASRSVLSDLSSLAVASPPTTLRTVLAGLVGLLLVGALGLLTVGVVRRRPSWREGGLGLVVVAAICFAVSGDGDRRGWVVVAAPLLVVLSETARLATDGPRASRRCRVESTAWAATATAIALVAAMVFAATVAVVVLVPTARPLPVPTGIASGVGRAVPGAPVFDPALVVPSGMLPAALVVLAVGVVTVALFLRRLGSRRQVARRPALALAATVIGLTIGAVVLGAGAEARLPARDGPSTPALGVGGAEGQTGSADAEQEASPDAAPEVLRLSRNGTVAVAVAALVALVLMIIFSRRLQLVPPEDLVPDPLVRPGLDDRHAEVTRVETLDKAVTVAAIEEALVGLRDDADPRVAVRVAYAIVTKGLGRADLARGAAETEGEYLRRALVLLGAGGEPLHELTALFWRARFSDDEIDESMRARAVQALERIRQQVGPMSTRNGA